MKRIDTLGPAALALYAANLGALSPEWHTESKPKPRDLSEHDKARIAAAEEKRERKRQKRLATGRP